MPGLQGPQGLPGEVGKAGPIGATGARGIKVSYEFKVMEMTLSLSKRQTGKKGFFCWICFKVFMEGTLLYGFQYYYDLVCFEA